MQQTDVDAYDKPLWKTLSLGSTATTTARCENFTLPTRGDHTQRRPGDIPLRL